MSKIREDRYSYDFAEHKRGGMRLRLHGLEILCRPAGALWVETDAALIVADLHLEKGSSFAARGQMLPPYDTRETIARLEKEVEFLRPRLIIFLGDTFHDAGGEDRLTIQDQARIEMLAIGRTLVWLAGNHDPSAPRLLVGDTAGMLRIAGLDLVHEPTESPSGVEISGHLHPCAKVRGRAASVRRRCFLTDGERLILPAFGAYTGGLNVRDAAFVKLLRRQPLAAVLGRDRIHPIGWTSLTND